MYLPLSDPEAIYERSGQDVVSHMALPVGVDLERIELNVTRLASLCRLAGAKQLYLVTHDGGDAGATMDHMNIGGNQGGAATLSGAIKVPKRQLATCVYDDADHPLHTFIDGTPREWEEDDYHTPQIYKAGRLALYLDRQAMQHEIRDREHKYERGLADAKGWGTTLNTAIQSGFRQAAMDRYMPHEPGGVLLLAGGVFVRCLELDELYSMHRFAFTAMVFTYHLPRRLTHLYRVRNGEQKPSDFNWSVFSIYRADRAVVSIARASTSRFVRTKK